jgi:hypothetical protein
MLAIKTAAQAMLASLRAALLRVCDFPELHSSALLLRDVLSCFIIGSNRSYACSS